VEHKNGNSDAGRFFEKETFWKDELEALRAIVLATGLREALKWGKPCYTLDGANVAILYSLKGNCAIGFFKGALLHDPVGILEKPGGHSQAMRMARFNSRAEIESKRAALAACLAEAVRTERAGLQVVFSEAAEVVLPEEFQKKLDEIPALKSAFEALTPGRRRAYALYFSEAKRAQTRKARVEKYLPQILAGKGMND
jgi:uncharacterized protein YdeI (YjbR/CyaY-like superfamily)